MGAVTLANRQDWVADNKRVVEADVTFSSSYATGGDTVALTSLGLKQVDSLAVSTVRANDRSRAVAHTHGRSVERGGTSTAPTVKLHVNGAEAANASNQSTVTVRVQFQGS